MSSTDITNNFLNNVNISTNIINDLIEEVNVSIIFTNKKGDISYFNKAAKDLFTDKISNIKEIGYKFNFDIAILDKNINIIEFSPITILLESQIDTQIEALFEHSPGVEKLIRLNSTYISENCYMIKLTDISPKSNVLDYKELSKANKKLKEQISENDDLRSQAQAQAIRESLINKISNAIRNSLEINTILQTAVNELGKTLGTDRTILLQSTNNKSELNITHEYLTKNKNSIKGSTLKIEEDFFLQEVIETKEAATGNHTDRWDSDTHNLYKLITPVIHHNELFGMIMLIRANRKWHTEEINLVQSVADQLSVSIKNALLFEDTTSKNTKIAVLNEILKSINSSLILDDVFYTIGREINRLIKLDRASIAILDEKAKEVTLFARINKDGEVDILRSGPLITKGTAISWAIKNLKPILINMDDQKDFVDTQTIQRSGIKTAIIIPMIHKGQVKGIFYVGSSSEEKYTDSEVEIMSQIAGQIAVAVENAKLYWQTQAQALKETLINQIISSIRKSLILDEVLQSTVNELGNALGANNCLFKYYPNKDIKIFEYHSKNCSELKHKDEEFYEKISKDTSFKNQDIIIWSTYNKTKHPLINDYMTNNNIKSLLLLPIKFNDPIYKQEINIGLIQLSHSDVVREWNEEDINLLKVLSDQISITINQARLLEQSEQQKTEIENTLLKLKDAQTKLVQSEKMAALGQLVAGVAHEINTPVGSINSNNSIFNKCTEKLKVQLIENCEENAKTNQLLNVLEETTKYNSIACERITEIVQSLKNFARLDESELKKVDIHEGITSTLTLLRHELRNKITVNQNFGELPLIECYPNLLNQVIMNLLVNACHSIEKTGEITITTCINKTNAEIKVKDTGTGIKEEIINKIFDPGFTTKGVGVGTGLGLSICYQIIEKHKGNITVKSTINTGSTFTISIPIKQSN
ncbi:MAG: GAF domain-containing protein [Vampirovibrionia bacterium]